MKNNTTIINNSFTKPNIITTNTNFNINFKLPSINLSDNSKKISSTYQLIRLFIQSSFSEEKKHLAVPLLRLIFKLETSFSLSALDFINGSKMYGNWLKVSYLTGDFSPRDIPAGLWMHFEGSPMLLTEIVSILKSGTHSKNDKDLVFRLAISILNSYKVITVPTEPNFDSIVRPFGGDDHIFTKFDIPRSLEMLNIITSDVKNKLKEETINSKWHFSSASGPNGHAVWSSHLDAASLHNSPVVYNNLVSFCEESGMNHVIKGLDNCKFDIELLSQSNIDKLSHSKLHYLYEKGNKCRIIAISDYFTQESLTPLHNIIANILKNIGTDSTFNQDKGVEQIRLMSTIQGIKLHSFDLSAATDRLPIRLQEMILSEIFSPSFSASWSKLIIDRLWQDQFNNAVRYAVGQPMGTKTSFPMLALSHHVIVQQAALNAGHSSFSQYVILGDDIVIGNSDVAREYLILMNGLGVDINMNKSIVPSINTNGAEFASRLMMDGVELSPLPSKLMAKTFMDGSFAGDLQNDLVKRGFISSNNIWHFFSSFLRDQELMGLVKLNGLPIEVSGLSMRFPNPDASSLNFESWETSYGFTKKDLLNFFTYTVVLDQLSKLDKLLKSSNTTLSSMLQWSQDSGYIPLSVSNGNMTLNDFMVDIMVRSDKNFFHPAQEIARSESNRLSDILTQFIMAPSDMQEYLRKGLVDALKLRLDEQFQRKPDNSSAFTLTFRRILERSLRLTMSASQSKKSKIIRASSNLESMNQVWNLTVGIGVPFSVSPVMNRATIDSSTSTNRIKSLAGSLTLSEALQSKTPEERRKFHPGDRLTASK